MFDKNNNNIFSNTHFKQNILYFHSMRLITLFKRNTVNNRSHNIIICESTDEHILDI